MTLQAALRSALLGWAAVLFLVACGRGKEQPAPPKPEVVVIRPQEREIIEWDEYVGRVVATDEVEVRARVAGMLLAIHYQDGKVVKAGDLLFTIDPAPFEAALERARAETGLAKARFDLAQANLARTQQLFASKAVSKEEADIRGSERNQAAAAVDVANAGQKTAELNLSYTQVKAPISGRASRHRVSTGNLIEGGTPSSTLLTTIVAWDPIHVYFEVDERVSLKYARMNLTGERASSRDSPNPILLQLSDEEGYPHHGVMDFVDNTLDPRTSTLQGRGKFANPDFLLQPGLFGRVRLPGSGKYVARLIPDESVGRDLDSQFVYVVNDKNVVELRPVKLGNLLDDGVRVVKSGLQPNERVVRAGLQFIKPGVEVTAKEEAMPPSPADANSPEETKR